MRLHEREQGENDLPCRFKSSMDHGEDEIASSDAKVWREINSGGNGTLPGPSFTAAAERGRSGRLKYPGLTYVALALIGATCRGGQCFCLTPPYIPSTSLLWDTTKHLAAASSIAE
jgi:hypothetical protein